VISRYRKSFPNQVCFSCFGIEEEFDAVLAEPVYLQGFCTGSPLFGRAEDPHMGRAVPSTISSRWSFRGI
jgi:hypothetical protein